MRVRDSSSGKPIPGIQCFVTRVDDKSRTNVLVRYGRPGHGPEHVAGFSRRIHNRRDRILEPDRPVGSAAAAGLAHDRARFPHRPGPRDRTRRQPAETFRISDAQGKVATLRHARASLVQGELFVDVDLEPTDPAAIGDGPRNRRRRERTTDRGCPRRSHRERDRHDGRHDKRWSVCPAGPLGSDRRPAGHETIGRRDQGRVRRDRHPADGAPGRSPGADRFRPNRAAAWQVPPRSRPRRRRKTGSRRVGRTGAGMGRPLPGLDD